MKVVLFLALCGFATGSQLRIVGNTYAPTGAFPFLVSIQVYGGHICGGSLITTRHVLTAAHCIQELVLKRVPMSSIKVVVGTNVLTGGTIYDVTRLSYHPSYQETFLIADVAVIHLSPEVTLSATVRTIALPRKGQTLYVGTKLDVSGFGANHWKGLSSVYLKMETVYIVSYAICRQYWPGQPLDGFICAALGPGHGTCEGDSGGPVIVDKRVIVGIVSGVSRKGCGLGVPDLFTSVSYYLDYIYSEIAITY